MSCGGGALDVVGTVGAIVDMKGGEIDGVEISEVCLLVEVGVLGVGSELEMIGSGLDEIEVYSEIELC